MRAADYRAGIARRLNKLLAARGLTKREVARHLGVPDNNTYDWYKGHSAPPPWRAPELAALLGVTPGYLLFGDGE